MSSSKRKRRLTFTNGERHGNNSVGRRSTVENTDVVGQVVENRQIVLDGDDEGSRGGEGSDDSSGVETLLDIEVGGRLVEHVARGVER